MEKLAAGLTILILIYTVLVWITLWATGWLNGQEVLRLEKLPVRIFRLRKPSQPA
jgi:hypothetical protein